VTVQSLSDHFPSLTRPFLPKQALEPYIQGDIMEIHHSKHHQTYVNNYNAAEEKLGNAFQANDLTQQLTLQNALKFNGGGNEGFNTLLLSSE
jgi:Fe-Mn family superoxide dismutase